MKFVLHNGQEQLTGWLTQDQLLQTMAVATAKGGAFWLRERKVICIDCPDREQPIFEYPVGNTQSSRCRPHDSKYLVAAGVRNRSAVFPR